MNEVDDGCNIKNLRLLQIALDGVFFCPLSIHDDDGGSGGGGSVRYAIAVYTCMGWVLLTFIASTFTNNYSQVDKLWSIAPVIYAWMFVVDARTGLMAVLVTIWGIRLSYNFYRRGGFVCWWQPWRNGEEDYRWSYVRRGMVLSILTQPIPWLIFNFVFISLIQNVILLFMVSPSIVVFTYATTASACPTPNNNSNNNNNGHFYQPSLGWGDVVISFLFFLLVVMETIADNQQYTFHTEKRRYHCQQNQKRQQQIHDVYTVDSTAAATTCDYDVSTSFRRLQEYHDGFCQSGLFAIVRKPNYAAEQGIWISYYIFSVLASSSSASTATTTNVTAARILNWSMVGMLSLLLLFQGTGTLTEHISQQKYPQYQHYMRCVPRYIPNVWTCIKMCYMMPWGRRETATNVHSNNNNPKDL